MQRLLRHFLLVITATLTVSYVWMRRPDLFFPPPESFALWLATTYEAKTQEDVADLELLYVFSCSLAFVLILTCVGGRIRSYKQGRSAGKLKSEP